MEVYIFPIAYAVVALMAWLIQKSGVSADGEAAAVTGMETTREDGRGSTSAFTALINDLASGLDLSTEVGRKEAYNRCYEHACEHLSLSAQCNQFLAEAAEMFGQTRIHMDLVENMAAPSGAEKFHVAFDGNSECELTGNRSGLIYMSRVFRVLSETPMEGEHIHFNQGDPAMQGNTHGLTVFFEPDEWFDRNTQDYEADEEAFIPERKIAAGAVIALCVTVDFPPTFYMSKDKIYRIMEYEEYDGQEGIAAKRIRESTARMYTFTLVDDRGEDKKFAFDLDDVSVVFFTSGDLEQVRCS